MHPIELGRTLIIVNPVAQSGKAAAAADRLRRFLALCSHDASAFHVKRTELPRHATELAAAASGFDTVLALGGDGVVHEVANGLMRIEPGARPTLGVVPVGSGNDFARSLGLTDVADVSGTDFSPLLQGAPKPCDILRVEYGAAGGAPGSASVEYALETISFGLDAAIAIDTHAMRRSTKLTGTPLYLASGLKTFGSGYRTFASTVRIDGETPRSLETIIFAVQNGATYGSGFRICPDADISDGELDICYATGPVPRAVALPVFLSAKNGAHTASKHVHTMRARRIDLTLAEDSYPIQVDGERLSARSLSIEVVPLAMRVLAPLP